MDYSLCNALNYNMIDKEKLWAIIEALIIYDVACQFWINFVKRIQGSPILQGFFALLTGLNMLWAVGKFHLAAHKEDCYASYSLNHIEGAGQVDGETMEPLWSRLNAIFTMGRAMSHAGRQELTDSGFSHETFKKIAAMRQFCAPWLG